MHNITVMNKLSVVIVNLNNAEGLKKTLSSVFDKQTFKGVECIVIDRGSGDGSADSIKGYEDKISYWVSEPDRGVYNAMNKGVVKATGEYLLFLDSGDRLADNVLIKVFAEPFVEDIVYGDLMYCCGSKESKLVTFPDKISVMDMLLNPLERQSVFIRRELFAGNLYKEEYKMVSDWAFLIEEFVYRNRTSRHLAVTLSYRNLCGAPDGNENRALILEEKRDFLDKYHPVLTDLMRVYRYAGALDTISNHRTKELVSSLWIQRSARHYMKLLLTVKKWFKIKG